MNVGRKKESAALFVYNFKECYAYSYIKIQDLLENYNCTFFFLI